MKGAQAEEVTIREMKIGRREAGGGDDGENEDR